MKAFAVFLILSSALLCSACFAFAMFAHPNKRDLKRQKIPTEILGSWNLLSINNEKPNCPITITLQIEGKLTTSFLKQYEGWFWVHPNGHIEIQCGLSGRPYYQGYEKCSIGPNLFADYMNYPKFKWELKNDTLTMRDSTFSKVLFKKAG